MNAKNCCDKIVACPAPLILDIEADLPQKYIKRVKFAPQVTVISIDRDCIGGDSEEMGRSSLRSYQNLSYEGAQYRINSDREGSCTVPTVNLTGIFIVVFFIVSFSWVLDELYGSFHVSLAMSPSSNAIFSNSVYSNKNGNYSPFSFPGTSYRSSASLAIARAALALCMFFVIAVWGVSAYIKIKYLTPGSKDEVTCPPFSW
mmetsp:Transcript_6694/g.10559  ORF Transcript_6694/g.10559 Transcript_6694/m.10559 type:complete len:202 (+) Transcript_6694:410-1015(+)